MTMPRDLIVFRRRIATLSAFLIALCTTACMVLLAVPLIDADMVARRHMLEELSNQPFDIEQDAAESDADQTSGVVVTGNVTSWCRVAVDELGEAVAVEFGGGTSSRDLTESDCIQLVRLRDEGGGSPFTSDGRQWIGLWQPLGVQDGSVTISDGSIAIAEGAATEIRVYTFLDVTAHGEFLASLILRCAVSGVAIVACAAAVAAFAITRSLRPVAESREREREFIFAASHELKTPLMAIISACDVLEAETDLLTMSFNEAPSCDEGESSGVARWIAVIREAADEMAQSVSAMLRGLGKDAH